MTSAIIVVIVVGLPLLFYSFLMFDRLVEAEYKMKEPTGKRMASQLDFFGMRRNVLSFGADG